MTNRQRKALQATLRHLEDEAMRGVRHEWVYETCPPCVELEGCCFECPFENWKEEKMVGCYSFFRFHIRETKDPSVLASVIKGMLEQGI